MASGLAEGRKPVDARGRCATFYSYKGGVGRTLAVAGVAADLALRHGKRVLAIDWDLDTPSLHLALGLEDGDLRNQAGLVDYIAHSADEFKYLQEHQLNDGQKGEIDLRNFLLRVEMPGGGSFREGALDLLSAGNLGPEYLRRLGDLDWRDLYAHHGGFWIMERLRLQASYIYDYILIDARAGRSDVSLIPLLHFSDIAFLVFAANEAGVQGMASIAPALAAHRRLGRMPLAAVLLPTLARSVPPDEELDRIVASVSSQLVEYGVDMLDGDGMPGGITLPYDVHIARTGVPSPIGQSQPRSPLQEAYSSIADLIADRLR